MKKEELKQQFEKMEAEKQIIQQESIKVDFDKI